MKRTRSSQLIIVVIVGIVAVPSTFGLTTSEITAMSAFGPVPIDESPWVSWFGAATPAMKLVALVPVTALLALGAGIAVRRCSASILRPLRDITGMAATLAGLAAKLAGRRRTGGHAEWAAMLADVREDGRPLAPRLQLRLARGFMWAAIRMRARDLQVWAGRRLDWLLTTDDRVAGVIAVAVGAAIVDLLDAGGFTKVVENAGNLGTTAGLMYAAALGLRKVRGVTVIRRKTEEPDPEPADQ